MVRGKASVFENFEEETRRKIARMQGNYGAISGLGMVKQKMGTLLSLFVKPFRLRNRTTYRAEDIYPPTAIERESIPTTFADDLGTLSPSARQSSIYSVSACLISFLALFVVFPRP